jgi:hypothetical protein
MEFQEVLALLFEERPGVLYVCVPFCNDISASVLFSEFPGIYPFLCC